MQININNYFYELGIDDGLRQQKFTYPISEMLPIAINDIDIPTIKRAYENGYCDGVKQAKRNQMEALLTKKQ